MLAIVSHGIGIFRACHGANSHLLIIVIVYEIGHPGINNGQFCSQFHRRVRNVLHRVDRHTTDGFHHLTFVGINTGHITLGRNGDVDALQGHVGLGILHCLTKHWHEIIHLSLRSIGFFLHCLGSIDDL